MLIIGVLLAGSVTFVKIREDAVLDKLIDAQGSCYLDDGTCLHDEANQAPYIIGWVLSGILVIFGIYIGFIDKTQQVLAEHQIKISSALEEAKKHEKEKDEFSAFLSGFDEDEQKVLKAVKEQDGIKQSTLRYKTGISKSSLSLLLKSLEEKEIISRKEAGKTNEVYLRKKF